jgi:hypothetical protein
MIFDDIDFSYFTKNLILYNLTYSYYNKCLFYIVPLDSFNNFIYGE